uniref:Uncharacterized protein n=1 Tax=Trichogramma kaykai TaxID=54128 RepID=A0ABD2X7J7_9HYME
MLYTHARKSNPLDFPNVNIKYEPSWNKTLPWNMRARMTLSPIRAIIHTEEEYLNALIRRQYYVRTRARRRVQREQRASIRRIRVHSNSTNEYIKVLAIYWWKLKVILSYSMWFKTCLNLLKQ